MGLGEHHIDDAKNASSRTDTWRTPEPVVQLIYRMFGGIGLDPAGHPDGLYAKRTILLPEYRGQQLKPYAWVEKPSVTFADGLRVSWSGHGLVCGNPPWSDIAPWLKKGSEDGDEVLFILPARVNAVYFHELFFDTCGESIGLPRTRMQFVLSGKKQQNPYHTMLAYYGARRETFSAFMHVLGGQALYCRG